MKLFGIIIIDSGVMFMGRIRRNDDRRKRDRKYWLFLLLLIVVGSLLLVTVSYTVGSTVLNIVGFNATQTVSWDVQIANVSASRIGRARFSRGNVSNTMIKGLLRNVKHHLLVSLLF